MKAISTGLAEHLDGEVTTLATCLRILRQDGVALGFSSHDAPLLVDNLLYRPNSGFTPSAIASSNALDADDLEVEGALAADGISADDLAAGRYDGATVTIFLVNWRDLTQGKLILREGRLGEVTLKRGHYTAEARGLIETLRGSIGAVCSPECRAELADERCKADPAKLNVWGEVTAASGRDSFADATRAEADGWFDYGLLTWHTGANASLLSEVKGFSGGVFTLRDALPATIAPGDLYSAMAGCDQRFSTCKAKFGNALNFRGEPHVPGVDALLDYPGMA